MHRALPAALAATFLVLSSVTMSCGLGTIAAAGSASSGSSSSPELPPKVVNIEIPSDLAHTSPVDVNFDVVDDDSSISGTFELRYLADDLLTRFEDVQPGEAELVDELTVANLGSAGVAEHLQFTSFQFGAPSALGPGLHRNVRLFVVRRGQTTATAGVDKIEVDLGNADPSVTVAAVSPQGGEFESVVPVNFTVADVQDDVVCAVVRWTKDPSQPFDQWTLAQPGGSGCGATWSVGPVTAFAAGAQLSFGWNTNFDAPEPELDLHGADETIYVNVGVQDMFGSPLVVDPNATQALHVDNNREPFAAVDTTDLAVNSDARRGIVVPVRVRDVESDDVRVVVQWRYDHEPAFPDLPAEIDGPTGLVSVLRDPSSRRALRIAEDLGPSFEGHVVDVDGATDRLRLPELATRGVALLSSHPAGAAASLTGREIEILRADRRPALAPNLLLPAQTVDVLALDRGERLLALYKQSATTWGLREVTVANGVIGGHWDVDLGGQAGEPQAMCYAGVSSAVLVAVRDANNSWRIVRIDLADPQAALTVYDRLQQVPVSSVPAGLIGGITASDTNACVLTVRSSATNHALVHVAFGGGALAPRARVLHNQSDTPAFVELADVVADPLDAARVFVADRGASKVYAFDLRSGVAQPVRLGGVATLALPTQLAIDDAQRLFVLTESVSSTQREVQVVTLGRGLAANTDVLEVIPVGGRFSMASAEDGCLAIAHLDAGQLYVGGGVEQVRTIDAFDPATQEVSASFDPPVASGARWRIAGLGRFRAAAAGVDRRMVWDSSEAGQGGRVLLRAVAYDHDRQLDPDPSGSPEELQPDLQQQPTSLWSIGATSFGHADVDQDGDLDVIAPVANELRCALQTAPGTFAPQSSPLVTLSGSPAGEPFAVADLDLDGDADLAWGGRIYHQTAPLVFQLAPGAINAIASEFPHVWAVGDVDGDGRPDLIAEDKSTPATPDDDVAIYFQSASAAFSASAKRVLRTNETALATVPFQPARVALGDFDFDGLRDVVVSWRTRHVCVFLAALAPVSGPQSPSFRLDDTDVSANASPSARLADLAVADLSGDGRDEVVFVDSIGTIASAPYGCEVQIYGDAQIAAGVAAAQTSNAVIGGALKVGSFVAQPDPYALAIGDADADGDLDLACANRASSSGAPPGTYLCFQDAAGQFGSPAKWSDDPSNGERLEWLDLDGDGDLDLAAGARTFFREDVGGRASTQFLDTPVSSIPFVLDVALDHDFDGDLDLLGQRADESALVATQVRSREFATLPLTIPDLGFVGGQAAGLDYDADGRRDLVVLNGCASLGSAYLLQPGDGSGTSTFVGGPCAGVGSSFGAVDLDDTGAHAGTKDLELIRIVPGAGVGLGTLKLLGLAGSAQEYSLGQGRPLVITDLGPVPDRYRDILQGDGSDIVAFQHQVGSQLLGGPPQHAFVPIGPVVPGFLGDVVDAVDVDADGLLDLVLRLGSALSIAYQSRLSPGTWSSPTPFAFSSDVQFVDVDRDGWLDAWVEATPNLWQLRRQVAPRKFVVDAVAGTFAPRGPDIDGDGDPDRVEVAVVGTGTVLRVTFRD